MQRLADIPQQTQRAGLGLESVFWRMEGTLSLSVSLSLHSVGLIMLGMPTATRLLHLKYEVLKLTSQKSLTPQHLQDKLETSKSEIQSHA